MVGECQSIKQSNRRQASLHGGTMQNNENNNQNNYRDTGHKVRVDGHWDQRQIGVMGLLINAAGSAIAFYDAGYDGKTEWDGETVNSREVVETNIEKRDAELRLEYITASNENAKANEQSRDDGDDVKWLVGRFIKAAGYGRELDTSLIENMVVSLLANGANPNYDPSGTGDTPLMWAVQRDLPVIVKALLDAGASTYVSADKRYGGGSDALELLAYRHDCLKKHTDEIRAMLLAKREQESPLLLAA